MTLLEVVIETGMGCREAEEFMDRLAKGTHVRLEENDQGTIYYDFPEIVLGRSEQTEECHAGGTR